MWYRDHIGMWIHSYGFLTGNWIRVCTAACQNPILYPLKLEVECHCILARNQVYISSHGWLVTVDTVRISNRRGAFVKVNVGHIHTPQAFNTVLYGPGVTDHIRDGRPMATVMKI